MSQRYRRNKHAFGRALQTAVFAAILQVVAPLWSQTAALPQVPTLTVNARLVVLDVVATGKDGKPVEGLTQKDFKVYENNELQNIRSFESASAHGLPAASLAAGSAQVFDPAHPASFGASPVTVLVLDQLNTHFSDSAFARNSLQKYLSSQPALLAQPTTLLSIYEGNFKMLQGFTRDRDLLLQTLQASPTKYAWELETSGNAEYGPLKRLEASLHALDEIAQSYASIPGRKNLVWVGGGFPTLAPTTLAGADAQEVKDDIEHTTNILLDTRITMYAVDPTSSAAGLTEITDEQQADFADASADSLFGNFDPFDSGEDFDRLGPVTGGRVVRGLNDVPQQIASSIALGGDYYTIAYAPTSKSDTAAPYRKVRVLCLVPGVTVHTRDGYYDEHQQRETSATTIAYDLSTAAESNIPLNALHIRVETLAPTGAGSDRYKVLVDAPGLTWTPDPAGGATSSVAVLAVALSSKGKMMGHTLHGMTARAGASVNLHDPARTADFEFNVKPVAKSATLRFIVRDNATGHMGSFDLPLKP